MAMRRCRSASSSALRLAIRRCIASAARSARSGSSSCAAGIPKTAITASPMNFSTVPPYRVISSRIAAKKRAISARIGSGSSCLVRRVEPAGAGKRTGTTHQTTSQVMAVDTVRLLQTLSDAFGVTGFEDEVRETLRALVEPYADEIRTDVLGNLLVTRRGGSGFTVMLDAHLDEIGLIVNHIDEKGFLHFATLGGWDTRILPAEAVTVRTREGGKVRGVIGSLPPHILKSEERDKPIPVDSLFIDVGASSAEHAASLGIRVGDPVVLGHPFEVVREGWLLGKAFDDRAGCAVLVKVLEELAGTMPEATLVMNFAVSEETGLRGARTAAFQIDPQIALAVEATVAADLPGVAPPRQPTAVGKGAAITIADASSIVSQRMVRALETLAQRHEIRHQLKVPFFGGGTDAGAIQTSRAGVLAGIVSIPVRYIHSPVSLMWLDDFDQVVRLVTAFAREAKTLFTP